MSKFYKIIFLIKYFDNINIQLIFYLFFLKYQGFIKKLSKKFLGTAYKTDDICSSSIIGIISFFRCRLFFGVVS